MKLKLAINPGTTANNKTGNWRTYRPKFLHDKCIACGNCARICPEGIIKKIEDAKTYYDCDIEFCKGCGLCSSECPAKAIIMELDQK